MGVDSKKNDEHEKENVLDPRPKNKSGWTNPVRTNFISPPDSPLAQNLSQHRITPLSPDAYKKAVDRLDILINSISSRMELQVAITNALDHQIKKLGQTSIIDPRRLELDMQLSKARAELAEIDRDLSKAKQQKVELEKRNPANVQQGTSQQATLSSTSSLASENINSQQAAISSVTSSGNKKRIRPRGGFFKPSDTELSTSRDELKKYRQSNQSNQSAADSANSSSEEKASGTGKEPPPSSTPVLK